MESRKALRIVALASIFALMMLSVGFISPIGGQSKGASATTGTATNSNTSLTVTTGHDSAKLELVIKHGLGVFAASNDNERAKFSVLTDNYTGYTLSIAGTDNSGKLFNSDGSYFESITSPVPITSFSNDSYVGKWGYQPSVYNSTVNTDFLPAPTTTPTILDVTSTTSGGTPKDYSISLGARADSTTHEGVYTGAFTVEVVSNPVSYAISYADASGDGTVKNLPPLQSSVTSATKTTLSTQTPTRTNFTFLRWCLGTVTNNGTTCTGTTFNPGAEFGIDQTGQNTPILYAVWSPNIIIRTNIGISNVSLKGENCNTDINPDALNGCVVTGLEYGQTYNLAATTIDGYHFESWDPGANGTIADIRNISTAYTVGGGPTTITPSTDSNQYSVVLKNTNATTPGSTTTMVTYKSMGVSPITNPSRGYQVSGFSTEHNNASGAVVSNTEPLTNSYFFIGWFDSETGGNSIITNGGVLELNTPYTDGFGRWAVTSGATLYAHWDSGTAVALPTISKSGYTCGWTTETNTDVVMYASGYSGFVPTENTTLYGVCGRNSYTTTVNFASDGITSVTFEAAGEPTKTITTSGSTVGLTFGVEYTMTMNLAEKYEFTSWTLNDDSYGILGSPYANPTTFEPTAESGNAVITAAAESVDLTTITYMQDVTPAIIRNTTDGTTKSLKDKRNNKSYNVIKVNGNLWMRANLQFDDSKLYFETTNIRPEDCPSGKLSSDGTYCSISWGNLSSGSSTTAPRKDSTHSGGYWYNYAGATVGTITGNSSKDATSSVCPKGWRLPTSTEFTGIKSYKTQFNPVSGGLWTVNSQETTNPGGWAFFGSGTVYGKYGHWYSSTASGSSGTYWLNYNGSNLSVSASSRYDGLYVRCVGELGEEDQRKYMQDITAADVAAMADNASATMKDKRDDSAYKVTKINGNLWMTQNLKFLGDTLEPATSNVPTTVHLSWKSSTTANSVAAPYYHAGWNVWYNYAGATAMEIVNGKTTNATQDICPKGWRLPTKDEYSGITSYKTAFDPSTGGTWDGTGDTPNKNPEGGDWWSSTANGTMTYMLRYSGSSLSVVSQSRYDLRYVRCIWNAS